MNSTLIYIIITDRQVKHIYPPVYHNTDVDYLCLTSNNDLVSDYFKIESFKSITDINHRICELKQMYSNCYEVNSDEILIDSPLSTPIYSIKIPDFSIYRIHENNTATHNTCDSNGNYIYDKNTNTPTCLLSIIVPVSNQISTIRRCLDGIMPLLQELDAELIVADTGSTDGTIEVCRSYNARIIDVPWCNDMSYVRNRLINNANGQWFMSIDDDEWFEDVTDIIDFFRTGKHRDYDTMTYIQRNYSDKTMNMYNDNHTLRSAKITPAVHFEGRIHDAITVTSEVKNYSSSSVAHHLGFATISEAKTMAKFKRNISHLIEDVIEYPTEPRFLFQAGKEFNQVKRYIEAKSFFYTGLSVALLKNDLFYAKCNAVYLLASMYNNHDSQLFITASSLSDMPYTSAERAFISLICADLAFTNRLSNTYILNKCNDYIRYRSDYLSSPQDSNVQSTIGLAVCTDNHYITDYHVIMMCISLEQDDIDSAMNHLSQINQELILYRQDDFIKYILNAPSALLTVALSTISEQILKTIYKNNHFITTSQLNTMSEKVHDNSYYQLLTLKVTSDPSAPIDWFIRNQKFSLYSYEILKIMITRNFALSELLPLISIDIIEKVMNVTECSIYSDYYRTELDSLLVSKVALSPNEQLFYSKIIEYRLESSTNDSDYLQEFRLYCKLLYEYISQIYNQDIINSNYSGSIPNKMLAAYYYHCSSNCNIISEQIKLLKEVITLYPPYKRGVELELISINKSNEENEIKKLAKILKENIETLRKNGKIEEAEKLEEEMKEVISNDI